MLLLPIVRLHLKKRKKKAGEKISLLKKPSTIGIPPFEHSGRVSWLEHITQHALTLVIAVAVSENTPTPLTLATATLTLYCVATCRPVKVVLVTWGLSWVTRDVSPPVGESSRIQLVMGAVVSGVMTGGWGGGGGGGGGGERRREDGGGRGDGEEGRGSGK